jgi:hypothetical protein
MLLDLDGMTSEHSMSKSMNIMKELKMEILTGLFLANLLLSWGPLSKEMQIINMDIILLNMLRFLKILESEK